MRFSGGCLVYLAVRRGLLATDVAQHATAVVPTSFAEFLPQLSYQLF
jgi:hypothetical protein